MSSTHPSIAVIGAGPGGLAAAVLLAASGCRVTIYESGASVGGRTGRITLADNAGRSFVFDRGPTFFLMPYVLEEIFSAAARRLTDYADLTRLDPMYRLILGRKGDEPVVIDTTQDIDEMARRLSRIRESDGANFHRFIADTRTKLRLMEPVLRSPMRNLADVVTAASPRFLPHLNPHLSVNGLLERYFSDPYVRLAVSFQSKYLGMSPLDCPSLFTILPFIEYEYGIWHPRGGCNALMAAMAQVVCELNGTIRCSSPVTGLSFDGSRVVGVVTEGPNGPVSERFDHVVINADAAAALKRFVPAGLRPSGWSDDAIDRKRYSCSTYMLYIGIDGDVDLPHHTIYVSERYRENLDEITRLGTLSEDPSVYVCNPAVTDPTLCPSQTSALYVLMPTPSNKPAPSGGVIDWKAQSAQARRRVLNQLEHRFGIRDVERRILVEKPTTPADWQAGVDGTGPIQFGATFNLAHNLGQMLHRRVQHQCPGIDNLWFVGGGTHPGSGLPVIFLSSQITARALCEREGLAFGRPHVRHDVDPPNPVKPTVQFASGRALTPVS